MTDTLFGSVMVNGSMTGATILLATACSVLIGLFIAWMYTKRSSFSKSFVVTLALLPVVVQLVIMLVNGNVGAGVAVAGAFSLVRFRSAAGKAEEIATIFLAMATGLATGMGYLGIAVLFAVLVSVLNLVLVNSRFGEQGEGERTVRITIPEDMDFEGIFDDLLEKYTTRYVLMEAKTAGMGSLYKIEYKAQFRKGVSTKAFLDELRERNGNLEVSCGRPVLRIDEL